MNEFLLSIMGTDDYIQFFTGVFFVFMGILMSLLFHTTTRDIHSARTAIHFSARFLLNDNTKRLIAGIISALIVYRFSADLINMESSMYAAFIIGFAFDKMAQLLKDKANVLK